MDQEIDDVRPSSAIERHDRPGGTPDDDTPAAEWLRRLNGTEADGVLDRVRDLVSEVAQGPFGPLHLTSYRFPDGRIELHLELGPERLVRLSGVGPTAEEAGAALLAVVARELAAGRLDRWRGASKA